ncbi:MAG: hypothetical protein U9R53_11590 [Chloroflexota bacterium]|nr:hypothetical protein [Chloroflexota bacterium]
MEKKKLPVISIIFYILAGISLAYAIWAIIYSAGIVSEAISMGQLMVEGSEFEIVSYYVSNIGQFVLFAAVLIGLGWILQILSTPKAETLEEELAEIDIDETPLEEDEEEPSEE